MNPNHAVWRKGRDGKWCLFGTLALLSDRRGPIPVKLKDGSTEHRRVIWNSKPFDVDGVQYCFAQAEEKRRCESCDGWHLRQEVRSLYGKGKGAFWFPDQKTCNCGGLLAKATPLPKNGRTLEELADAIDEKKEITDEEMEFISRLAYQEKDLLARCCLNNYHQTYSHPEQDFSQL